MRRVSVFALLSTMLALSGCAPEGSTAYVSFNVKLGADCIAQASANTGLFIGTGAYDVGGAIENVNGFCARPYVMYLQVNSNLRSNAKAATGRAEPNVLQINSAQVTLKRLDGAVLSFARKVGGKTVVLPNPFLVTTNNTLPPSSGADPSTGVVQVEAIPVSYAHLLNDFDKVGQEILVEVQIFGTTLGDVDIDFKPFVFPVKLCKGCLYVCSADLGKDGDPSDLYGDECPDNAGADGRVCIDPNSDGTSCADDPRNM